MKIRKKSQLLRLLFDTHKHKHEKHLVIQLVNQWFDLSFFNLINSLRMFCRASTSEDKPQSLDEVLIDYLIKNSFLWDKSNQSYRNRAMKDTKWKEIADKLNLTSTFCPILSLFALS